MQYEVGNTSSRSYFIAVCVALLAIVLILLVSPAQAQETGAGDAAHFLRNGVGARALSMGGAFVAVASDATASVWNPAGLTMQYGLHLGASYENQFGGLVTSQFLGGTYVDDTWGIGASWFNSDLYSAYFLSAAIDVGVLSLGASGKLYSFSYGSQSANGLGADVGALFDIPFQNVDLRLGLVSRDIGWSVIHWHGVGNSEEDRAAWVTNVGAAVTGKMDFGSLMGTADLEVAFRRPPNPDGTDYLANATEVILDLGVEAAIGDFALRAGLADIGLGGAGDLQIHPTLGLGATVMGIEIDAAWISNLLGATYLLSVEFVF